MKAIWLIILFYSPAGHGVAVTSLQLESEAACHKIGKRWESEMTVILNPDSNWTRSVRSRGTYKCFQVQ